jgi:hypothetical protein
MKKALLLFASIAFISLPVIFYSCEEDYTCKESSSSCGSFEACCTSKDCYYLYDGDKYKCDGTDCTDAAQRLANVMCSKSINNSEELILKQTQDLLNIIND